MNSTVFVGVGQCGIQILKELIATELEDTDLNNSYLIRNNKKLGCILVDTEPKVINSFKCSEFFRPYLKNENLIAGRSGRGSNWCFGYNGCFAEKHLNSTFLESFRKEVEGCDNFLGCVLCHSLGGGTGSGLGSHLTELIRDEFELHQIMNCVVAPSDNGGDSPLQYYNVILSLATIYSLSNCVYLFHNDAVINQLGLSIPTATKLPVVVTYPNPRMTANDVNDVQFSMQDVNRHISSQISAFLSPCSSIYPWKTHGFLLNAEINEFIRSLASSNNLKIVQSVTSAVKNKRVLEWEKLISRCNFQLKCGFGNFHNTISAVACYRGTDKNKSHLGSVKKLEKMLKMKLKFVQGCDEFIDIWFDYSMRKNQSLTVAFNSGSIGQYLEFVRSQAQLKFDIGAYLHWYYKHGGSKELFEQAFKTVDEIIRDYLNL